MSSSITGKFRSNGFSCRRVQKFIRGHKTFNYGELILLETKNGALEGKEAVSRSGKKYFSFGSIPYAEPPLGDLRFKNPILGSIWNGTLNATKPAPLCMQSIPLAPDLRYTSIGTEDCLYMNIYTRSVNKEQKLPVLVYIHGGGFRCGTAGPEETPDYIMDEEMVFVSFHFRLGPFGFLSTEDIYIPGNFGLKDQVIALKWLKINIEDYGGNPDLITIFGESSGGACVHYLLVSPLSKELVKGGISQSGVMDASWALAKPGKQRQLAIEFIYKAGCDSKPNALICLQSKEAEFLVKIQANMSLNYQIAIFQPVIEPKGDGAFMTEDPRLIPITKPWITGIVEGEGLSKTASFLIQNDSVSQSFIQEMDIQLPKILYLDDQETKLPTVLKKIKNKYFKDLGDLKDVINNVEKIYMDYVFIYPAYKALQRHLGPKYAYLFGYKGENSLLQQFIANKLNISKPSHGDDILLIFNWTRNFQSINGENDKDKEISEKLIKLWTNFAKNQNPTPEGSQFKWDQYENQNVLHMTGDSFEMKTFSVDDDLNFWSDINSLLMKPVIGKDEL